MLSLLVMFSMVTVTFMLVAGQYKRMSRIAGKVETVGNDPRKQLDEAFGQLTRGTLDPQSSLYRHDLLGDLYGHDGVKIVDAGIEAQSPTLGAGPGAAPILQLIDLRFNAVADTVVQRMPRLPTFADAAAAGATGEFDRLKTPGHFNGCVLTFLDGDLKGQSTRIVGWGYTGTRFVARIVAVDGMTATAIINATNPTTKLLINGRPFNGTGFGLNLTPGGGDPTLLSAGKKLSMGSQPVPYALMPNPRFFESNAVDVPPPPIPYTQFGGLGGADEDYDAADPQNMALAYVPLVDLSNQTLDYTKILPSFHRPDLLRHLSTDATYSTTWSSTTTGPRLIRKSMLRPFGPGATGQPDHPGFTGSNPTFNALTGPWDVDNDGDGVAESVWVDIGLPVQAGPDGRRYKPLVAYHCVDLDGRLNVNAHGTWAHSMLHYDTSPDLLNEKPLAKTTDNVNNYLFNSTGNAIDFVSLPRGMGVGPAEIDLSWLWGYDDTTTRLQGYKQFLEGRLAPNQIAYEGRYGEWNPGAGQRYAGRADATAVSPFTFKGPDDLLALIRRYDMPLSNAPPLPQFNYYASGISSYGSPSDLWGRSMVGVDYAGQPIWSFHRIETGTNDELGYADWDAPFDPYTLNLSRKRIRGATDTVPTVDDNIFTPAELERVLRRYDLDAGILPDRLRYLLDPDSTNSMDYAHLVTTDSFDLPTPAVGVPRNLLAGVQNFLQLTAPTGLTITDILKIRLAENGVDLAALPQDFYAQFLPPEVIAGQKFDLNRPFGNGRDDNGNGVVDEPTPHGAVTAVENEMFWRGNPNLPTAFANVVPDYSNGGNVDGGAAGEVDDSRMARQLYARYLYVMMYLLTDMEYDGYSEGGLTPQQKIELNARRIAQWAINVVDYRDPDSIMTPFEYDLYPFDAGGWQVDGFVGMGSTDDTDTHRRVVWGCEAPELLLTETLAFHDRRVIDLDNPDEQVDHLDPMMRDEDMDQQRVPEGSLFLELYCPHNGNYSIQPDSTKDLFTVNGNQKYLDLGRTAPAGAFGTSPVWRVAITASTGASGSSNNAINSRVSSKPDSTNFDPVPPGSLPNAYPGSIFDAPNSATIERIVWFSGQDPTGHPEAAAIYYNAANSPTLLRPGQFAVVGPRDVTYVGRNVATATEANQRFLLDIAGGSFTYRNSAGVDTANTNVLPIICSSATPPNPITGVWSRTVGVSISEPLFSAQNYYPYPDAAGPIPMGNTVIDSYTAPNPLMDVPFDTDPSSIPPRPLLADAIAATGRTDSYKTALLQRLANPLMAFDPVSNPYITVDWQPIDLNVFNGEDKTPGTPNGDKDNPLWTDPNPYPLPGIGSRERGTTTTFSPLWNSAPQQPTNVTVPRGINAAFPYDFDHTIGYLNQSMGSPWFANSMQPPPTINLPNPPNYGYLNAPDPTSTPKPFSWITWNNRPYTNGMELLLVPPTSAEQLLRNFSNVTGNPNAYTPGPGAFYLPFKHLTNFFLSEKANANFQAPYYYRILDYVGVPSPFVGTDTVFSPDKFGSGAFPKPQIVSTFGLSDQELASYLHPPFSRVSNYRDPGRVNINTIAGVGGTSPEALNTTWTAIVNGSRNTTGDPQPRWQDIVASRRGDNASGNNVTTADASKPSVFLNPFRTAAGAAYRLPLPPGSPIENEVNVTMLRPKPGTTEPLFANVTTNPTRPYVDPNQHAYFRYQDLMRLSNSLTTRSNVYAVWITVGYFEVSPAPSGASGVNYSIYPDGWQLGAELGSDTGDIQRHRAFYIFDRSIPVGYEPGKDHNLDQATLVKRYIE